MAGAKTMEQVIAIAGRLDPSLRRAADQAEKILSQQEKSSEIRASRMAAAAGKAAKAVGAATAAATTATAAGVVAVTKQALDNYASYEQLVGGVETLFKDSSDLVVRAAKNAYETAGMDANTYMETVTSFSASMISSLGGDTEEAARKSHMAMTDMADNANKMGTSIESIQGTYQSLARGNYGMLDNLKLGYGGTKSELERLLADAERYKAANGEMASYSIDSFADVVDAIHVVQDEMDITGTTAKEASVTIEGSVNAAKAQWQNWLRALGEDDAELGEETYALIETITTAAKNIGPRVAVILSSLFETLPEFLPQMMEELGAALGDLLTETLGSLFGDAGHAAGNDLIAALGSVFASSGSVFDSLVMVAQAVLPALMQVLSVLLDAVAQLAPVFADVFSVIAEVVASALELIMPLIAELASTLLPIMMDILFSIMPVIEVVGSLIMQLFSALQPLLDPIMQLVCVLLPPIASLISTIMSLIGPVLSVLSPVIDVIGAIASVLGEIVGFIAGIIDTASRAAEAIGSIGDVVGGAIGGLLGFATGGFTRGISVAGEDPRYPVEAVISFNPAYRAENLRYWQMAGAMLGAKYAGAVVTGYAAGGFTNTPASIAGASLSDSGFAISGTGEVSRIYDLSGLVFSPQITVQGDGADAQGIVDALRDAEPEVRDFLLEVLEEWDEVAYE